MRRVFLIALAWMVSVQVGLTQVPGGTNEQQASSSVESIPGDPQASSSFSLEPCPPIECPPSSSSESTEVPASSSAASLRELPSSSAQSSSVPASSSAQSSKTPVRPVVTPTASSSDSSESSASSESSSPSSQTSSTISESSSGFGFWDRENFGYSVPFIDPSVIASPSTFSWGAVPSNIFLSLLFTVVIAFSGFILFSILPENTSFSKVLSVSALMTIILIELFEMLVPSASAQSIEYTSGVSFLRLPWYAFLFFIVTGITDTFYGSLRSMPIKALDKWLKKKIGKDDLHQATWFLMILLFVYAVVSAYRNRNFELLPAAQIGLIFVTITSILIKTYSTDFFKMFMARRWKYPSWFQANIGGLVCAIMCVYVTRAFELNPGFMYGLPLGLYLLIKEAHKENYLQSLSIWWSLGVATVIWFVAPFLKQYEVIFDVLVAIPFILIEGLFFDLLPIPSMTGGSLFQWKKLLWFIQFAIVTFLLFQIIFHPEGSVGSIQESPPTTFMLMGVACYVVGTCALWAYVKLRRRG